MYRNPNEGRGPSAGRPVPQDMFGKRLGGGKRGGTLLVPIRPVQWNKGTLWLPIRRNEGMGHFCADSTLSAPSPKEGEEEKEEFRGQESFEYEHSCLGVHTQGG